MQCVQRMQRSKTIADFDVPDDGSVGVTWAVSRVSRLNWNDEATIRVCDRTAFVDMQT